MIRHRPRLIALHCAHEGFGYAVFDGRAIHDWGTVTARGDKNAMSLSKLGRLLDRFSPETLVLEEASEGAGRAARIVVLHKSIAALCRTRNIDLYQYALADVRRCFDGVGAHTRQDIAEAVVRELDVLSPRLPRPRKAWQSEPRRMMIFSAAALALTHLDARD